MLHKYATTKGDGRTLAVTSRGIVVSGAFYRLSCYKNYIREIERNESTKMRRKANSVKTKV